MHHIIKALVFTSAVYLSLFASLEFVYKSLFVLEGSSLFLAPIYALYCVVLNFIPLYLLPECRTRKFWQQVGMRIRAYARNPIILNCWIFGSIAAYFIITRNYWARDIWLDEYVPHARLAANKISSLFASVQQQPPSWYVQTYAAYLFFGHEKFAYRINAIWCYLSLVYLLPVYIYSVYRSSFVVVLVMFLFFVNPVLSYFSVEGRPYNLILYWAVPFVYLALLYLRRGYTETRLFFCVMLMLSLAAALQTVWLIGAFCAVFLLSRHRKHLRSTLISVGKLALILVPINCMLYIYANGLGYYKEDFWQKLLNYIEDFRWENFTVYFFQWNFSAILLAALLIFGLPLWPGINTKNLKKLRHIGSLFGVLIIFVFSFDIFYRSYVSWNLYNRYTIILNVLILFIFASLAKQVISFFKNERIVSPLLQITLLVTVVIGLFYNSNANIPSDSFLIRPQPSHAATFDFIAKHGSSEDYAMLLELRYLDQWENNIWSSKEVYFRGKNLPTLASTPKSRQYNRIIFNQVIPINKFSSTQDFKIFLVTDRINTKTDIDSLWKNKNLAFTIHHTGLNTSVRVIELKGENKLDQWKEYLVALLDNPTPALNSFALHTLIYYAHEAIRRKELIHYCNLYRDTTFAREQLREIVEPIRKKKKAVLSLCPGTDNKSQL